jgi:hypothetical protein
MTQQEFEKCFSELEIEVDKIGEYDETGNDYFVPDWYIFFKNKEGKIVNKVELPRWLVGD